jgi:hypothetical protein
VGQLVSGWSNTRVSAQYGPPARAICVSFADKNRCVYSKTVSSSRCFVWTRMFQLSTTKSYGWSVETTETLYRSMILKSAIGSFFIFVPKSADVSILCCNVWEHCEITRPYTLFICSLNCVFVSTYTLSLRRFIFLYSSPAPLHCCLVLPRYDLFPLPFPWDRPRPIFLLPLPLMLAELLGALPLVGQSACTTTSFASVGDSSPVGRFFRHKVLTMFQNITT